MMALQVLPIQQKHVNLCCSSGCFAAIHDVGDGRGVSAGDDTPRRSVQMALEAMTLAVRSVCGVVMSSLGGCVIGTTDTTPIPTGTIRHISRYFITPYLHAY